MKLIRVQKGFYEGGETEVQGKVVTSSQETDVSYRSDKDVAYQYGRSSLASLYFFQD